MPSTHRRGGQRGNTVSYPQDIHWTSLTRCGTKITPVSANLRALSLDSGRAETEAGLTRQILPCPAFRHKFLCTAIPKSLFRQCYESPSAETGLSHTNRYSGCRCTNSFPVVVLRIAGLDADTKSRIDPGWGPEYGRSVEEDRKGVGSCP